MTGLDKILEDIRLEAQKSCEKIDAQAREKKDALLAEAKREAERETEAIRIKSERRIADIHARAASAAKLRCRQALLSGKQDLIAKTLDAAMQEMKGLDADRYFEFILRLVSKSAHKAKGTIAFGAKDLERLPSGFQQKIDAQLPEGAKLSISDKPVEIDDGFLLLYDGIEENCTFEAMILANKETLQDRIRELLF